MLGLMAVAATYRARSQRATATAPAQPRVAPAAAKPRAATEPQVVAAAPAATDPPVVPAAPPADVPDLVPRRSEPAPKPAPKPQPEFDVARVKPGRTLALRSGPNGRVLARVGATTEFGSPTTLAVAARHGDWVGLTSTDLPNGKLGWVKRRRRKSDVEQHTTRISLRVDLSRRRLELRSGKRVLRRVPVGIGRAGSTTPTGRFSITDKLSGGKYGPYYGCCILALSGHQTNTPAGWRGGDRLAIHGTNNPASIGVPSSAGCLHASADDLRVLMRRVPLGTPVFIRR